jgi:hypothetical protein
MKKLALIMLLVLLPAVAHAAEPVFYSGFETEDDRARWTQVNHLSFLDVPGITGEHAARMNPGGDIFFMLPEPMSTVYVVFQLQHMAVPGQAGEILKLQDEDSQGIALIRHLTDGSVINKDRAPLPEGQLVSAGDARQPRWFQIYLNTSTGTVGGMEWFNGEWFAAQEVSAGSDLGRVIHKIRFELNDWTDGQAGILDEVFVFAEPFLGDPTTINDDTPPPPPPADGVNISLAFNELQDPNSYYVKLFQDTQENELKRWNREELPVVDGKHRLDFTVPLDEFCHRYFLQPCTHQDSCGPLSNWVDLYFDPETSTVRACPPMPEYPDPPETPIKIEDLIIVE